MSWRIRWWRGGTGSRSRGSRCGCWAGCRGCRASSRVRAQSALTALFAGVVWDVQVTAGQPGPVQGRGPGKRPGAVDGDAVGTQEQLPGEDLLVVDSP